MVKLSHTRVANLWPLSVMPRMCDVAAENAGHVTVLQPIASTSSTKFASVSLRISLEIRDMPALFPRKVFVFWGMSDTATQITPPFQLADKVGESKDTSV